MKKVLLLLLVILSLQTFGQNYSKREMRATWVATVHNIDWPVAPGRTSGEQISHLVQIFDSLQAAGINAVFFQARTECDALYESELEPWSYYITGEQGKAPHPYFDPLKFAIDEAHNRGMELHAWLNPYRAQVDTGYFDPCDAHVSKRHPEWTLQFGKLKILDPGLPQVREYILSVVADIVNRYDIDGIHFDDYFYPYTPIQQEDSLTYVNYSRGFKNIDDWRRDNINILMGDIHTMIKSVKPHVKYGISPFGIIENHYAGTDGFESYHVLYCDALNWIDNKILDYMNPQLYWEMEHKAAPYAKLIPWWAKVTKNMHLYAGLYSGKYTRKGYKGKESELGDQMRLSRNTDNVGGFVYFSAKSVFNNWAGLADSMKNDWYKYPAIPPAMEWLDNVAPNAPVNVTVVEDSNGNYIKWEQPEIASDGQLPQYYVVYKFDKDEKINLEDPSKIEKFVLHGKVSFKPEKYSDSSQYVVTSLDRLHNESKGVAAK